MKRRRGVLHGGFQRKVRGFGMNGDEFVSAVKKIFRDFVGQVLIHIGVDHEEVGNTDDSDIALEAGVMFSEGVL